MTAELTLALVAGLAGAASAVFAGVQLRRTRLDAIRRDGLDFLREVQDKVLACASLHPSVAYIEILRYYKREVYELSPGARSYMEYLTSLDRLFYALSKRAIEEDTVRPWLRDLWRPRPELLGFLDQLQRIKGDDSLFEYLILHLRRL